MSSARRLLFTFTRLEYQSIKDTFIWFAICKPLKGTNDFRKGGKHLLSETHSHLLTRLKKAAPGGYAALFTKELVMY